jgi:hypothetical protein
MGKWRQSKTLRSFSFIQNSGDFVSITKILILPVYRRSQRQADCHFNAHNEILMHNQG